MNLTERIRTLGIVPVVRLDRAEDAPGLAKALCEGGLPCAEVTFRDGSGGRGDPPDEGSVPGSSDRSRNRSFHRAGEPGSARRGRVYCESRV